MATNPVRAMDVEHMAWRLCDAARDRLMYAPDGLTSPQYLRACRAHERRGLALRRLAEALERQGGER